MLNSFQLQLSALPVQMMLNSFQLHSFRSSHAHELHLERLHPTVEATLKPDILQSDAFQTCTNAAVFSNPVSSKKKTHASHAQKSHNDCRAIIASPWHHTYGQADALRFRFSSQSRKNLRSTSSICLAPVHKIIDHARPCIATASIIVVVIT